MNITIRRLGEHRGAPRLYLDTLALATAGFAPGSSYRVESDADSLLVTVTLCSNGDRRVSRKKRGAGEVPVIDINSAIHLGPLSVWGVVRVVLEQGVIHILTLASQRKAAERAARLGQKLSGRAPLLSGSVAFGAGITSSALHAGLEAGGVPVKLAVANEICDTFAELAMANNPLVTAETAMLHAPMQEAVADDWALRRLPRLDILEAGLPCSGASRAGVSKRKLTKMEDHPDIGHLVAAVIQWIHAFQPALFLAECVPLYQHTGSAAILRAWLRDAGYEMAEVVLDASDFGSLEARVRWFLVAYPPQLKLSLHGLASKVQHAGVLAELLDAIGPDDERFRAVEYLKVKQRRDRGKGNGFGMQLLTVDATRVPTLRKGYHKGGSTDPRLMHPTDPDRSRLLTGTEHARIKGIDPGLLSGSSDTTAHMVCGQAVDTRPVHAIGKRLAEALLESCAALSNPCPTPALAERVKRATG